MKKDITLFGLLVCFYILVVTLLYTNKPKELGIQNIACNLDRALLQMAGFEPEGDLYAKAGSNWLFSDNFYEGSIGKEYRRARDLKNDSANWGFKNGDSRLHALLYAWAKDNPDEQITPEVIKRLDYLARTADSMNVSGRRLWENGSVGENENVRALIKQMQANPEIANEILKEKGFSKHSSPIQNYFAWAEQFMDDNTWHGNTERNLWVRNLNGGDFADSLSLASTGLLEDELIPAVINDIAKKSKLAEAEAKLKAEADAKRKEEIRRKNLERAGFGFEFDPEFKNDKSIPDEWIN